MPLTELPAERSVARVAVDDRLVLFYWASSGCAPQGGRGFWILEGDVTIQVGDEIIEAHTGDYAFGPHDIPHRYTVDRGVSGHSLPVRRVA
jgi:hypothetical protein